MPLTFKQIHMKCAARFGISYSKNTIRNSLGRVGVRLGTHLWGSLRHLPLTRRQIITIRRYLESILLSDSRIFTCSELLRLVATGHPVLASRCTRHTIDWILKTSRRLRRGGKLRWLFAR